MKRATIGDAILDSICIIADGRLTHKWKEEDREVLDDKKLSIGGLDIEREGRSCWFDTCIDDVWYDLFSNRTIIHLELWDDPDANPDTKQDLTEEDLFLDPEFYLWMEYESEESPKYQIRIELGKDKPNLERVVTMIYLDENQQITERDKWKK
jgi:hypothetical protein|tara:strand:- start:170 stop:628 length:459 start_codon:yes stop_codon:yes gene_type:complete